MPDIEEAIDHARKLTVKCLFDEILENPPSELHHYTTFDGLLGILAHQNLRATHAGYVNDSNEIEHSTDFMFKKLGESQKNRKGVLLEKLYDYISHLLESFKYDVYILCFSKYNYLLSQWKGYGSDTGSFMLSFDPSQFRTDVGRIRYTTNDKNKLYRIIDNKI